MNHIHRWLITICVASVAMLGHAGSQAFGGPLYSVWVAPTTLADSYLNEETPVSTSGVIFTPYFDPFFGSGDYSLVSASARAGRGSLSASTHAELYFPFQYHFSIVNALLSSNASFVIDDFVISGPGETVSGSLQLRLSGGVSANAVTASPDASATADAHVSVGGVFAGGFFNVSFSGDRWVHDATDSERQTVESGVLADGVELISIPFVNAPVGVPLTLHLQLSVDASAFVYPIFGAPVFAEANSSFSTLSFDTSGPAFLLPEGYYANSPTANVVDSVFVPEPSLLALASLGGFAFLLLGRVRCYKRESR